MERPGFNPIRSHELTEGQVRIFALEGDPVDFNENEVDDHLIAALADQMIYQGFDPRQIRNLIMARAQANHVSTEALRSTLTMACVWASQRGSKITQKGAGNTKETTIQLMTSAFRRLEIVTSYDRRQASNVCTIPRVAASFPALNFSTRISLHHARKLRVIGDPNGLSPVLCTPAAASIIPANARLLMVAYRAWSQSFTAVVTRNQPHREDANIDYIDIGFRSPFVPDEERIKLIRLIMRDFVQRETPNEATRRLMTEVDALVPGNLAAVPAPAPMPQAGAQRR